MGFRVREGGLPEYDILRKKVAQRVDQGAQQQKEALQRRFAALGALNSGAAIKQQQLTDESALKQREESIQEVDFAESQERNRRQDALDQRNFVDEQSRKARDFEAEQSGLNRAFTKEQNDLDRKFRETVFAFEKETKLKELDLAKQGLDLNLSESNFNKDLARYQAKKSGGLFGAGGVLGLGFGGGKVGF